MELAKNLYDRKVILGFWDNESDIDNVKSKILELDTPKKIYKVNIGAYISSHSIPSIVGIATI